MKTLTIIAAVAVLAASTSANAWWGPFDNDNYNNGYNSGFGNMMSDMMGDVDFSFNMKVRGRSNGYNNWNGYNGYNGYNSYGPYGRVPYDYVPQGQIPAITAQ